MISTELQKSMLSKYGVKVLDYEPTCINDELAKTIFGNNAKVLGDVTTKVLSGTTNGGWVRAGSEAYYQVKLVKTGYITKQLVAMKANISLGDIHEKIVEESSRLVALGQDRAPEVYAVARASFLKEFLTPDQNLLSEPDSQHQLIEMYEIMQRIGLSIFGGAQSLSAHTMQSEGRMKLIDAGTADISGVVQFRR